MEYKFHYIPEAVITISDEDFTYIMKMMKRHYDGTVQAAANHGGFMYGFMNRRSFSDGEDKDVVLSERQLGLVTKALERDEPDANRISKVLWEVVRDMQKKYKEINNIE